VLVRQPPCAASRVMSWHEIQQARSQHPRAPGARHRRGWPVGWRAAITAAGAVVTLPGPSLGSQLLGIQPPWGVIAGSLAALPHKPTPGRQRTPLLLPQPRRRRQVPLPRRPGGTGRLPTAAPRSHQRLPAPQIHAACRPAARQLPGQLTAAAARRRRCQLPHSFVQRHVQCQQGAAVVHLQATRQQRRSAAGHELTTGRGQGASAGVGRPRESTAPAPRRHPGAQRLHAAPRSPPAALQMPPDPDPGRGCPPAADPVCSWPPPPSAARR